MKNRFFVLAILVFGFVLAGCQPSQQSVQTPEQINLIDFSDVIKDKANIEGFGVLEYELYDVPGNDSTDFKAFVLSYTQKLDEYEFDHDNYYWNEDNTALSMNVKAMMANHKRNVSITHYKNPDGHTNFTFNYLNSDGKYEVYTVNAHIRGENKKDYDKIIADYTETIRLDPKNAEAYIERGWAYYMKNDYDMAILDYTEAIRLDPKNAEAYHYRGLAYYWKDDYDKAIADYNESIRFDSTSAWTYTSRGNAYYLKEDYNKAIIDYTEAIRLDPKSAESYIDRAEAYDKNGNYDRAIADYKMALRITPNDTEIKQKLEEVQRELRAAGNR